MPEFFLFSKAFRLIPGPEHPPTQWVPGGLLPGIKQALQEAQHTSLSSAKFNHK